MDKDLKAKWCAALRSGEYRQAIGRLINAGGAMCCMGVLGHIQGLPDQHLADKSDRIGGDGLRELEVVPERLRHLLAKMNDGTGGHQKHTFLEIADYIEREL